MATRKPVPAPAGPTCPECQRLAAELARLQKLNRQQGRELAEQAKHIRRQDEKLAASHKTAVGWRQLCLETEKITAAWKVQASRSRAANQELRQHLAARAVAACVLPGITLTLYPN